MKKIKVDAKEICKYIKEAEGKDMSAYAELISVYNEYGHVKKAMKSLLERKVDESIKSKIEEFGKAIDRIKIGSLVNRVAKMEVLNNKLHTQYTKEQKEALRRRYSEITNYIYTTVATMDRFLGKCFKLMSAANSERSTVSEILRPLAEAVKLINPCVFAISRKNLNELFAEVESIFAEIDVEEETAEPAEEISVEETTEESATDTKDDIYSTLVEDVLPHPEDAIPEAPELPKIIPVGATTTYEDIIQTEASGSDETGYLMTGTD